MACASCSSLAASSGRSAVDAGWTVTALSAAYMFPKQCQAVSICQAMSNSVKRCKVSNSVTQCQAVSRNVKQYHAVSSSEKQWQASTAVSSSVKQCQAVQSSAVQCQAVPSSAQAVSSSVKQRVQQCQVVSSNVKQVFKGDAVYGDAMDARFIYVYIKRIHNIGAGIQVKHLC